MVALTTGHQLSAAQLLSNWWTWWQGDVSGMIIVTPLILTWATPSQVAWSRREDTRKRSAFAVLLLLVAQVAFRLDAGSASLSPLMFLIVPFIVWAAFRFSQREVTTATAVGVLLRGLGRVRALLRRSASCNEPLLILLAFNSTMVATGLVLCAVLRERDRVMQAIREHRDELEIRVAAAHPGAGVGQRGRCRTTWRSAGAWRRSWPRASSASAR